MSVLQFGAAIPPLSPWQGVSRFLPGYRYDHLERRGPVDIVEYPEAADLDAAGRDRTVLGLLDAAIESAIGDGPDPVVLFSGGVDSGLLAARLAELGHRDTLLINYSFGQDDPESLLAEQMAKHLNLRFERIVNERVGGDCLASPGLTYSQPFADHSTAPTSDLAHAVVQRLSAEPRLIFDGTGADGAFGMTHKIASWQRLMRIPAVARSSAGLLYGSGLWSSTSKLEKGCRVLTRSATMPLLSAVIAQNPLAGIFYENGDGEAAHQALEDWIAGCVGQSLSRRVVGADLAVTCAGVFAQKANSVLRRAGLTVCYPFLTAKVLGLALCSAQNWQMSEPKEPLKRCLAQSVPSSMVYRAKSGFFDPSDRVFYDPLFISYLRDAIDACGPIESILKRGAVLRACDLLSKRHPLPAQTLNCLWAITFLDRWYRTAPEAGFSPDPA
jgi:asparagine synthetase B (glutamine-hydrolysing)